MSNSLEGKSTHSCCRRSGFQRQSGRKITSIDRASGESIDRITKDHSEADIRASLGKASGH